MAVSVADMNQIRVDILGQPVDRATTWTTVPPANANTLNTTQRVVNRAINELDTRLGGAIDGTNGFAGRFNTVVGNEAGPEQAAFDSIGMTIIEAVAALIAGGGAVVPSTLPLVFAFPDPLDTGDFVEITVEADCTIPASLAGVEYEGAALPDDMSFELTEQPTDIVYGQLIVNNGNVIPQPGPELNVTAGTIFRLTADDIVNGPVSPGAIITITATRKVAPPAAVGRFEFEQTTADTIWTIYHGLNQRIVTVQVVDSSGTRVVPANVDYDTVNRCILTFVRAKSGTAVVRT